MSTNYYVKEPTCPCPCEHCSAPTRRHIGKLSGGWEFNFRGHEDGPQSWQEWKQFLKNREITDEYRDPVSYEDFVARVEASRRPGAKNHYHYCLERYPELVEGYGYYLDPDGWSFSMTEFS